MKKLRTTIGVIIDTLGSVIIYVLIAAAILFMAGQAKHYYDVGYGVFSQQGKDAKGTGKVVQFTVDEGISATKLSEKLEEAGLVESAGSVAAAWMAYPQKVSRSGEEIDWERHERKSEIKAITFHRMAVKKADNVEVQAIVDL